MRTQNPETIFRRLPKTKDGFRATLGMKVYFLGTLDGFSGPHEVVISKMSKEHCYFECEIEHQQTEIGVDWDRIAYGRSNAEIICRQ